MKYLYKHLTLSRKPRFSPSILSELLYVSAMEPNGSMHIAMYPWLAFGHIIPFLQLSNKLAARGHRISFITPSKVQFKLQHENLYPNLITFVTIDLPHVDGLPDGAETTADLPSPDLRPLLATAMDLSASDIKHLLHELKPNFVFFDFSHWMPSLTHSLGIKSIQYWVVSVPTVGFGLTPERYCNLNNLTEADVMNPPPGFPDIPIKLRRHEAVTSLVFLKSHYFGSGILFTDRMFGGLSQSDAIAFRSCREIDGPILDYIESQFKKPLLVAGPVLPKLDFSSELEEKWASWLGGFKSGSVIFCGFGSETKLNTQQFNELVLGLELTGLPFLVACNSTPGADPPIETTLPEGFLERVKGRGIVHDGWVPQQKILAHPAVGFYVSHCGYGSLLEGLVNECELILLPIFGDQIFNARMMGSHLKVGVEVEKGEEDGLFSKGNVLRAFSTLMDEKSEVGKEIKANRCKLREMLLSDNCDSSYMDNFCQKLQDLLA